MSERPGGRRGIAMDSSLGQRGAEAGSSRGQVITVGVQPTVERADWLCGRIVRLLDAGVPRMEWEGDFLKSREEVQKGWWQPPGSCSWWALRQLIGGRVNASEFAEAIESLLAEGRVLEVWLALPDRREPPHCLLLPGRSEGLRYPVARARGLAEVLAREPWYKALKVS